MGPLDERVEDIEDGIAAPGVRIISEELSFVSVGGGASDAVAVAAERFELVDEFVNNVPCPVVLESY